MRQIGFKGINNAVEPERAKGMPTKDDPLVDLVDAVNIDVDDSGMLTRRDGTQIVAPNVAHSLWSDGPDCFFVETDKLKRLNPDFSTVELAHGLTPSLKMAFLKVNGRTYHTNGQQTGVVDGYVRSWGLRVPVLPGASVTNGALAAGEYSFVMTYLREDGQESGAGLAGKIVVPSNGGIAFSWETPRNPTVSRIVLYVSEPNGMIMYRTIVAARTDTGAVVRTMDEVGAPLATQWLDAPPAGKCLAYSNGRIFIGVGANLFATSAMGYEYCDMRDFLAIDGTAIRFIVGLDMGLYVGTEKGVYWLNGTRLDEMNMLAVVEHRAMESSALVADGLDVTGNAELSGKRVALFATVKGIFMGMDGGTVVNLTYERYRFTAPVAANGGFRRTSLLNQYLLTVG